MNRNPHKYSTILLILSTPILIHCGDAGQVHAAPTRLQYEVYATAGQVNQFCSDGASRKRVAEVLKAVGIDKIYIEAYRGDEQVSEETLMASRDFFDAEGFEVATGITTIPGKDAGVRGDGSAYYLNYEAQATRDLIKKWAEIMAEHFDEILVDDFFLTDDQSEESKKAKGERSWSEYRLDLMTEIARDWLIEPARDRNPKVRVNIKFPQWYDVFHLYGYNVETAPDLFDQIWLGTETRNPDTHRFGFAQPTMGFNNFRWLSSIGGEKTVGAWFDALDCHEDVYLMQAYQSVLAGAARLTLFNLGEYMDPNPVVEKFKRCKESVTQLAAVVRDAQPLGIGALKPPHSSPGNDLYLFDFLGSIGLPVVLVGHSDKLAPFSSILLSGHSKADPDLTKNLAKLLGDSSRTFLWTPSFNSRHTLEETVSGNSIRIGGEQVESKRPLVFRKVHPPKESEVLASVEAEGEEVPVFFHDRIGSTLHGLFLNVSTYSYEDFEKVDEMFLPPSELAIPHWPQGFADLIRKQLPLGLPVTVQAEPPFGLNLYDNGVIVVSNFSPEPKTVLLKGTVEGVDLALHPDFDHAEGTALSTDEQGVTRIEAPGWEIAVIQLKH